MKQNKFEIYLNSEEGREKANNFLQAARNKEILAVIFKRSQTSSGTPSVIFSIYRYSTEYHYAYSYDHLFNMYGYRVNKNKSLVASGGNIDLVYNAMLGILNTLKYYGFDTSGINANIQKIEQ